MAATTQPWLSSHSAKDVLTKTHYASPVVLFLVFLFSYVVQSILYTTQIDNSKSVTPQTGPGGKPLPRTTSPAAKEKIKNKLLEFSPGRKLFFIVTTALVLLTLVGNAVIVIIHALTGRDEKWWCGQAFVVYVVGTFFVYALILISIIDAQPSPSNAHAFTWAVSLLLELICIGASLALYSTRHREGKAFDPKGGKFRDGITTWESLEVFMDLSRAICVLFMLFFYSLFVFLRQNKTRASETENGSIDERTSLLNSHTKQNGSANGQVGHTYDAEAQPEETAGWVRPDKLPPKTWWEYIRGYSLFFPYLWPAGSLRLQVIVIICFVLLILGRVVNLLVPIEAGKIINVLASKKAGFPKIPWLQLSLFILFRLFQGQSGVINSIRSVLWIPISQYSYRELSVAAFEHVHGLSLDFHLGKKTGEVLSALNKGASINTFLEQVSFQVVPMLVDLVVAIGYFFYEFDIYYALIVALLSFSYMYLTIRLASWRADLKREVTNLNRNEEAVKNDSLVSYESVKYFNAEGFEFNRYRGVVKKFQKAEYTVLITLNLMNLAQNLCFMAGLMAVCFLAAFQISIGQRQVGEFVALLTYMAQLQAPLNFFGTFYRMIQSSMINSERMLELFKEKPTVLDKPSASELSTCNGLVEFKDVQFAYDPRRPAVNGLTFTCRKGTTTALVGESGGGKSTVFRLLFRFYDIKGGVIEVDGNDVTDITVDSLRSHIGVVPQDTVLFNESIMYNLKYANQNATEEMVHDACKAASIHEQILKFPDGYEARVGERGLKLSGGEKQRIAIARAILKDPDIILLDEATAALDTETEQNIHGALSNLSKGRTTIVIAHRLSTITTAEQILVLHQGKVEERGTHDELLQMDGRYAKMWNRQIRAQEAVEKAKAATRQAKKLAREAQGSQAGSSVGSSADHSEDEGRMIPKRGRARSEVKTSAFGVQGGGPVPHSLP